MRERAGQFLFGHGLGDALHRAERAAGGRGVRGVGFHQNGETLAAQQAAGKVGRHADHELHITSV